MTRGDGGNPGSRGRSRRAMTVIEVMVTLVVVVAVIGQIFVLLRQGFLRVYRGGDETLATVYASEILETIRGAPYAAFAPNGQEMTPEQIFKEHNIPEGTELENYDPRFVITARVSPIEGYDPRDMKKIEVTVTWDDRSTKKPKSAVLVTFYTPVK